MNTRIVSFAGRSIAIKYQASEEQQLVDFLYRDVASDPAIAPHVVLRIERDPERHNRWSLLCGDETRYSRYSGDSMGELADALLSETLHHLMDKSSQGMALHAGALSRDGKGIILPGTSGAGKSTLTTWLTRRGYNYLSDELIFIKEKSWIVEAFPRPITIKARGLSALRGEFDLEAGANDTVAGPDTTMIPHRLLNPDGHYETPVLHAVLFPNHKEGSDFELLRLSKGQAGLALMKCLMNARNLEGHGFGEAARIARGVRAYRLTYSSFGQLTDFMDTVMGD